MWRTPERDTAPRALQCTESVPEYWMTRGRAVRLLAGEPWYVGTDCSVRPCAVRRRGGWGSYWGARDLRNRCGTVLGPVQTVARAEVYVLLNAVMPAATPLVVVMDSLAVYRQF